MGLAKKFKIMDDNDNGTLDINEFKKAMKECKISDISDKALAHLFRYFDKDDSGSINYDEFLVGIRGVLSARRRELVNLAFTILDKDGSGVVDIKDIQGVYNGRSHPDVIGGRRTEEEVLIEFIDNFNIVKKNAVMTGAVAANGKKTAASEKAVAVKGAITRDMFIDYYSNLSASIDSDDYFELMIRNSWHISGGEGWSANTTNKRVLVKHADGRETVEEIKNDLGLKANDKVGMVQRLRAQGIAAAAVSTTGGSENGRGGDGSSSVDVAYYNSLHNQNVNTNGKAGTANASKPVGRVLWDVVGKANENVNPVTNPVPAATTLAKTVYIPANLKHLIDNPENNLAKTYPLRANQKKAPQPLGAYQS
jgi:Ca2+-binding EF-hand superfamily protein